MFQFFRIYNRPISPHLVVYSPQLTSLFSIWHRLTGVILAMFTSISFLVFKIFIISYLYYTVVINQIVSILYNNNWFISYIYLLILTLLIYHTFNGFRHIIWDIGGLLNIKSLFLSSYIILIFISIILILNIITIF